MGCPTKEFWYGDPKLLWIYAKVHRESLKRQNFMMWVQGIYFSSAVSHALDSVNEYPKQPLKIFDAQDDADMEEEAISAESQASDDAIRAQSERLDQLLAAQSQPPKEIVGAKRT